MEFRLIYDGILLGASRDKTRAEHKHEIRCVFHKQLKRLWETNPHLKERAARKVMVRAGENEQVEITYSEKIANKFCVGNYRCLPLATTELDLACSLNILFLRYDQPGKTLIQSRDIDNRLKTLFDALRRPQNTDEIDGQPSDDQSPLFCLLEDDQMITEVSVTTDLLLEPNRVINDVHVIINVTIKPSTLSWENLDFGA